MNIVVGKPIVNVEDIFDVGKVDLYNNERFLPNILVKS